MFLNSRSELQQAKDITLQHIKCNSQFEKQQKQIEASSTHSAHIQHNLHQHQHLDRRNSNVHSSEQIRTSHMSNPIVYQTDSKDPVHSPMLVRPEPKKVQAKQLTTGHPTQLSTSHSQPHSTQLTSSEFRMGSYVLPYEGLQSFIFDQPKGLSHAGDRVSSTMLLSENQPHVGSPRQLSIQSSIPSTTHTKIKPIVQHMNSQQLQYHQCPPGLRPLSVDRIVMTPNSSANSGMKCM